MSMPHPSEPSEYDAAKAAKDITELHDRVRKRIVDEDNVINHRMMWGTLAQTAIFAGFGFSSLDKIGETKVIVAFSIAILGCLAAFFTDRSIQAAKSEIDILNQHYKDNTKYLLDKASAPQAIIRALPNIHSDAKNHNGGNMLSAVMPKMLIFLWVFSMVFLVYKSSRGI